MVWIGGWSGARGMSVKLVIAGARGRMGGTLLTCAGRHERFEVVGAVDAGDEPGPLLERADALIDFSVREATLPMVRLCVEQGKALVLGTTGHTETERAEIRKLAMRVPTVWSSNFSTGVNALFWLTRKAAEILGPGYDMEILEMHHRMKVDAPSGTAKALAEILAGVRARPLSDLVRYGREGITGERSGDEIGVHSMRGGDVVGDHTVILAGAGERVELMHRASSRETFAEGALRAALWVVGRPPGIYSMQDVLGLG
jgi:4-hydroxy-tetrahydrodipicolinate reductase